MPSLLVSAISLSLPSYPAWGFKLFSSIYTPVVKFSVFLHCCQIKSKLSLISSPCYRDNNDTRLRVVLQGASIPGDWCFLAPKVGLMCGLHTFTQGKFPSCGGPLTSFPTRPILLTLQPTAKPSSSSTDPP